MSDKDKTPPPPPPPRTSDQDAQRETGIRRPQTDLDVSTNSTRPGKRKSRDDEDDE